MNAYESVYRILKMGVNLPDDAEEIGATDDGESRKYKSKSRGEEYNVPHHVGVHPDNPDDPHHGFSPIPAWEEQSHGYHPEVRANLTMPSDDNNTKTQMHQQLAADGKNGSPSIENLLAAVQSELSHREKKDDNIDE